MNNISVYNERMAKAIEDKLWFKEFLNIPVINDDAIVYDLGCADGELIRHLAPLYPNTRFVGIDNSEEMINLARQRQFYSNETYVHTGYLFYEKYARPAGKRILIMSSVFHELVNYNSKWEEELKDILDTLNIDYIFFRDMIPYESINRNSLKEDRDKIYNKCSQNKWEYSRLEEFENWYGFIRNQRSLVHYLLKYRYVENWHREVRENYIPCVYEELLKTFKQFGFEKIYNKNYILPYIKENVKEYFDIDLMDNTHVNVIFKRI